MTEESTLEKIASLAAEEREAVYEEEARKHGLPVAVLKARVSKSWRFIARPKQLPPDGEWMFWFLLCGRGFGKLLSDDTPLPTPSGWTTMGDVQVGDDLLDEAGRPTRVTWKSDSQTVEAYRVRFSDGAEILACADHQWVTWNHQARKAYGRSPYEDSSVVPEDWPAWRLRRMPGTVALPRETVEEALVLVADGASERSAAARLRVSRRALTRHIKAGARVLRTPRVYANSPGPQIRTTAEIAATLRHGKRGDLNHSIPVTLPLDLPEADLAVPPYVLGYWLGDGTSTTGQITIHPDDQPSFFEHAACYEPRRLKHPNRVGTRGLHRDLRELGVLGNKHVPPAYLRASAGQRLALLQGLMDSDGYASGETSHVEFVSTLPCLADAVAELARSLGEKPIVASGRSLLDGREHKTKYRVTWRPTVVPFRLARKAERVKPLAMQGSRSRHRMIVSVDATGVCLPMHCVAVDSPHRMYLAGDAMVPTHNTLTAAQWTKSMALERKCRIGLIAPTLRDVRGTMIEGEALALDTLVPTPDGYTTMGALRDGDTVLGGDGKPCKVVHAHPILYGRECFRVRLKGGAEIVADGRHRWLTEDYATRAYNGRYLDKPRRAARVRTTEEIRETLRVGSPGQANHGIRVAVTEGEYAGDLPIDPYVLGAWLGDGLSKNGAICDAEGDVVEQVRRAGYRTRLQPSSSTVPVYGVLGLQRQLRETGLVRNKHVPAAYLRAAPEQRLALVQGLMDTDGYVSDRGQCEFVSKRRELADALVDLLCGLGVKASAPRSKRTRLGTTHWLVKFTTTQQVFRMPRKVARLPARYRDAEHWYVRTVDPIDSVPVRCITVDSPDRTYLVTRHHVRTHNTGILSILPTEALLGQSREIAWNKSLLQLTLANGTIIEGFSSDVPDRLRGPQHDYVWAEEVSSWLDASKGAAVGSEMNTTWSNMILGLRLGERPRACLTSTPKANRLTRELVADQQGLVVVSGSSYENQSNLSDHWWRNVVEPLRGTRTGRQEIEAELLEDVEGALWTRAMIDEHRVSEAPHLGRIVVAVDPNTTSGEASDDAGIVVAGRGHSDRHGYVLADHTVTRGGPAAWALAAVRAYHEFQADRVVAEANNGGEMVAITIKSVDATVPVKIVHASRGKRTRAEPVASLYTPLEGIRDALVHHVGSAAALSDLEDEMTTWTGDGESPNRMDALVWALTELNLWQPVGRHRSGIAKGGRRVPGVKLGEGLGELAAGAAGGYTSG